MSDTVKIIIEIPEEVYELLKNFDWKSLPKEKFDELASYEYTIAHGIPLDDVKAKISEIPKKYPMTVDYESGLNEALNIIDNIGKGE